MRGKSYAANQAKRLLNKCNVKRDGTASHRKYITNVKGIAKQLGIEILPYSFSEDISGLFFKKGDKLYLGVNSSHSEKRKRFTIAHEIGHFILHSDEPLHYDVKELESLHFRSENISDLNEIESNSFAAELLMPEELVRELIEKGVTSVKKLSEKFNVSEEAMRYRLINLGYL